MRRHSGAASSANNQTLGPNLCQVKVSWCLAAAEHFLLCSLSSQGLLRANRHTPPIPQVPGLEYSVGSLITSPSCLLWCPIFAWDFCRPLYQYQWGGSRKERAPIRKYILTMALLLRNIAFQCAWMAMQRWLKCRTKRQHPSNDNDTEHPPMLLLIVDPRLLLPAKIRQSALQKLNGQPVTKQWIPPHYRPLANSCLFWVEYEVVVVRRGVWDKQSTGL